jgi:hypothetical protein
MRLGVSEAQKKAVARTTPDRESLPIKTLTMTDSVRLPLQAVGAIAAPVLFEPAD